jgi:hypothetical protein
MVLREQAIDIAKHHYLGQPTQTSSGPASGEVEKPSQPGMSSAHATFRQEKKPQVC